MSIEPERITHEQFPWSRHWWLALAAAFFIACGLVDDGDSAWSYGLGGCFLVCLVIWLVYLVRKPQ